MAPMAARCSLGDCETFSSPTVVLTVRKIAMYNMATNCRLIPIESDLLRPMMSISRMAVAVAERNLTTPRMAVASNFSLDPEIPTIEKYSTA